MIDLWMPEAVKVPGHPDKIGYESLGFGATGPKRGTIVHSAEGWGAYLKFLVQTPLAIKSWHFSILQDGTIWQHYPIDAHCWHAGDTDDDDEVRANIDLDGIEEEGLVGQPLTPEQTSSTVRVIRFQADYFDRDGSYARFPIQPANGWTLGEHNQVSNTYTACPSDRIPWDDVLEGLEVEEDNMTFIGVGCDKATLNTPQFESYRLYVAASGLERTKITTREERLALKAGGFPLLELTRAELEEYQES